MRIVLDILRVKGHAVWSIHPGSTVYEALQAMAEKNVGALLVIEDDRLVGIFSERDYARKVILAGRSSLNTAVKEIMSDRIIFVRPEQTIDECMALMTQNRVRHLPVLDGSKLIGVISIGDVVKEIIADQTLEIQQLENYILGRGYVADPLQR
ncbi:MAG: CBS domain-containing protein [Chloroflexi bacterium]|nr:CBS domain-containing protein [Chloroflexota bacterium]